MAARIIRVMVDMGDGNGSKGLREVGRYLISTEACDEPDDAAVMANIEEQFDVDGMHCVDAGEAASLGEAIAADYQALETQDAIGDGVTL